jgi:hypothetical protein
MRRIVAVSLFAVMMCAGSAHAADENSTGQVPVTPLTMNSLASMTTLAQRTDAAAASLATQRSVVARRPSALPSLYLGSALLQGFDAYSTLKVLGAGGSEANPVMRSVTRNPTAFIAVKAGITAASIIAAERMWKDHNRVGAVVTMVVSNVLMGVVAANNSHVMSQIR